MTVSDVPAAMLPGSPAGPVTPQNAMAIADAYACVRALADAAASVPLVPYRRAGEGRVRVEDGAAAELLRRPAPAVTQSSLIGQLMAHLQLYGNAYVGKFRDGDGQVDQLALLHPDRVTPEVKGGRPLYTINDGRGGRSVHGPEDVVHVKGLTTDGVAGLAPVRQCRVALGLSDQLAQHAKSFFENDARPAGVLRLNQFGASEEQLDEIREGWSSRHAGTRNAHRIAVVTGEVEFVPVTMPLDDAQFLEQRKLSAVEVARVFRVPPHMIGADPGSSLTYQTAETAALDFAKFSLRPWLVAVEQALSADEDLFPEGTYCEFLLDALLRADSATRAEVYAKALDPVNGWMDRDEVRRLENLEAGG